MTVGHRHVTSLYILVYKPYGLVLLVNVVKEIVRIALDHFLE